MNKPRIITILISVLVLGLIVLKNSHSEGVNFAELEYSDAQKVLAQHRALDSLTNIYKNKPVTACVFKHSNGKNQSILVYNNSGPKVIDTLSAGDKVQLISTVTFKGNPNTKIRTQKGLIGYVYYFQIRELEDGLSKEGLEMEYR
jgi:hypothetical protein